jgi:hypothetical protein
MISPLVVAFPRTMRALPLGPLGVISALVAAPTVMTVARAGDDLGWALIAAAVVGGAGLAYAVDDDAADLLAASPTTLAARRAARIVATALVVAVGWFVVLVVGWTAGVLRGARIGDLAIEAIAAAGIAVAVASGLRRDLGAERVGMLGAATAVVAMLFVTILATRYAWMPALGTTRNHDLWLWLACAAWLGVWWTVKDPAGRRACHLSA